MSYIIAPANKTLQFSDQFCNIAHIGSLASNVGTSPVLVDFPTTNTGTSLGHYHFKESLTNATRLLNLANDGTGGHKFLVSSFTSPPIETASIGVDGITVDKSIAGGVVLVNLPAIIVGQATSVVFTNPPSLDTFGIQFGVFDNPVQVLFNSGPFTTGVTYYARATNSQTLEIRTTVNPSDPPLDCTSFTNGQIPFAYVSSNTPPSVNVINMYEQFSILTDTTNMILSDTALTFNSINVKMNQVIPTLIYSSPLIYADGYAPTTSNTIRNTFGYSGWHYKNAPPNNAPTNKINWFFPPKTATNTPVSSLKGISISFFNGTTTSNDDTLFITIYTIPTGSGDYAPGFFHSSNTYVFDQAIVPVINTNYQGVCILDKSLIPFNYETQIQYEQSTINNPRGTFAPTDNILAVVIGTNSASATNAVQLVVNKLNLHYVDFTQSYLLVPP